MYSKWFLAESAEAIEYTDCISAVALDPNPTNKCLGYDIKHY